MKSQEFELETLTTFININTPQLPILINEVSEDWREWMEENAAAAIYDTCDEFLTGGEEVVGLRLNPLL